MGLSASREAEMEGIQLRILVIGSGEDALSNVKCLEEAGYDVERVGSCAEASSMLYETPQDDDGYMGQFDLIAAEADLCVDMLERCQKVEACPPCVVVMGAERMTPAHLNATLDAGAGAALPSQLTAGDCETLWMHALRQSMGRAGRVLARPGGEEHDAVPNDNVSLHDSDSQLTNGAREDGEYDEVDEVESLGSIDDLLLTSGAEAESPEALEAAEAAATALVMADLLGAAFELDEREREGLAVFLLPNKLKRRRDPSSSGGTLGEDAAMQPAPRAEAENAMAQKPAAPLDGEGLHEDEEPMAKLAKMAKVRFAGGTAVMPVGRAKNKLLRARSVASDLCDLGSEFDQLSPKLRRVQIPAFQQVPENGLPISDLHGAAAAAAGGGTVPIPLADRKMSEELIRTMARSMSCPVLNEIGGEAGILNFIAKLKAREGKGQQPFAF